VPWYPLPIEIRLGVSKTYAACIAARPEEYVRQGAFSKEDKTASSRVGFPDDSREYTYSVFWEESVG
jgi:hypothetical protein